MRIVDIHIVYGRSSGMGHLDMYNVDLDGGWTCADIQGNSHDLSGVGIQRSLVAGVSVSHQHSGLGTKLLLLSLSYPTQSAILHRSAPPKRVSDHAQKPDDWAFQSHEAHTWVEMYWQYRKTSQKDDMNRPGVASYTANARNGQWHLDAVEDSRLAREPLE